MLTSVSHLDHKATSPTSVTCFVLTISDTRTDQNDTSGQTIGQLLETHGHHVAGRRIVRDDPAAIRETLVSQLGSPATQIIITTGGTGITSRDSTYEVVSSLLDKRLDGFGELFRVVSYQEIGPAAMLSRAVGGLVGGIVVFALPGSSGAVRLGLEKLILPELGHLVFEKRR